MSSFPVIKLFSLFIKQLSKPAAGYIKRKAKESYFIRKYICIPPAQLYHRCDVRLRIWTSGVKKRSGYKIPPLTEERAIDDGADLLGETFIFGVAVGLLGFEYHRQARHSAMKEEKQEHSLRSLTRDTKKLRELVDTQSNDLDELVRLVEVIRNKSVSGSIQKHPTR